MLTQYCHRCAKIVSINGLGSVCTTDMQEEDCTKVGYYEDKPLILCAYCDTRHDPSMPCPSTSQGHLPCDFAACTICNPKTDQEFKADAGKPNPTLLEKGVARATAVVQATLDYGNLKYEAHSWKNVPNGIERYDAAARRHRNLRDQGETHDVESWLPHLAHEIINNLFLLEMMIADDPGCQWKTFNPNPPQEHKK